MKNLREKAERLLEKISSGEKSAHKEDLDIVHEILVYQKELELQNEELRETQRKLEDTKTKYFELYNNAPTGYVSLNNNGLILECNETFLKIIESPAIKKSFTSFSSFIHKDDLERFMSIYRRYFEHPEGNDLQIKLNTGNVKFVTISGKKSTASDGATVLMLSVLDITESYLAKVKADTYLDIIENAQVSIVITDKHNRIEYVNKYFTKLTGYSREEAMGKNPGVLASGQTSESVYKEMWKHLDNGRSWNGVFINKNKYGKIYYEDAYITPIFEGNGDMVNYFAVKLDVTDKLLLRKKDEENEKLKSLVKLTGGIAHNLNNFLTPVTVIAEYFEETLKDENLKRQCKILVESVRKSAEIMKKLLKYSQNYWMNPAEFDLGEFFIRNRSYFDHMAGASANFKLNLKEKNIPLYADESLIMEAILNVLENSKNAVGKNIMKNHGALGEITVSVSKETEDMVKISISDNGVGMNEQDMSRAFEPFFSTNGMALSQGLGLSTTKGIVEQHGGSVNISSNPGKGTVVEIRLPLKRGEKNELG